MIRALAGRVLVLEPAFDLELARSVLEPTGASVEPATDARGDDVVALLVGPDQPVGRRELDRLPALRAVATCSVGFDHVDVAAAEERGVVVANVPDYCIEEMADSTLALLLSLLRGVVLLDRSRDSPAHPSSSSASAASAARWPSVRWRSGWRSGRTTRSSRTRTSRPRARDPRASTTCSRRAAQ